MQRNQRKKYSVDMTPAREIKVDPEQARNLYSEKITSELSAYKTVAPVGFPEYRILSTTGYTTDIMSCCAFILYSDCNQYVLGHYPSIEFTQPGTHVKQNLFEILPEAIADLINYTDKPLKVILVGGDKHLFDEMYKFFASYIDVNNRPISVSSYFDDYNDNGIGDDLCIKTLFFNPSLKRATLFSPILPNQRLIMDPERNHIKNRNLSEFSEHYVRALSHSNDRLISVGASPLELTTTSSITIPTSIKKRRSEQILSLSNDNGYDVTPTSSLEFPKSSYSSEGLADINNQSPFSCSPGQYYKRRHSMFGESLLNAIGNSTTFSRIPRSTNSSDQVSFITPTTSEECFKMELEKSTSNLSSSTSNETLPTTQEQDEPLAPIAPTQTTTSGFRTAYKQFSFLRLQDTNSKDSNEVTVSISEKDIPKQEW